MGPIIVVVRYLYVGWSIVPVEHEAVLLVDGDGPLSGAITLEPVEPCPRVVSQVVQRGHCVQNVEPAFGLGLDSLEPAYPLVKPNSLRISVRKRPYRHDQYVIRYPYKSRIPVVVQFHIAFALCRRSAAPLPRPPLQGEGMFAPSPLEGEGWGEGE